MRSATSRRASGSRTSIFCKVKHFFAAASFLRDIFAHCKQTKQLRLADLVCRLLVYIQQNTLFFIARADQMPANPSFSLPQSTATSTFPPIYAFFGRPFSTAHAIWSAKTAKTPSNLSPKAAIRQTKHTFCQSLVCQIRKRTSSNKIRKKSAPTFFCKIHTTARYGRTTPISGHISNPTLPCRSVR